MKLQPFCKTYNGERVLEFPGSEAEAGNIYAIIGANGSGKSTFAKILAGAVPADQKGVVCDAKKIGYMPQKSYPFRMSVEKNILLGGNDTKRAAMLMDALKLQELAGKRADRISGGETARMALARLLMRRCDLLILDEPCAPLDMESTKAAETLILEYVKETNCVLFIVTHSLRQARRLADHVLFFANGQLIESGTAKKVLDSPEEEDTKKFLEFYGT